MKNVFFKKIITPISLINNIKNTKMLILLRHTRCNKEIILKFCFVGHPFFDNRINDKNLVYYQFVLVKHLILYEYDRIIIKKNCYICFTYKMTELVDGKFPGLNLL